MKETNEKGITLITLVITIIIMIILLGVTIDIVINEPILEKTQNVVNEALEYQNTIEHIKNEARNQIKGK